MTNKTINELMSVAFKDHMEIRNWLYAHNHSFGMSPSEMMQVGRSNEVIAYLYGMLTNRESLDS